MDGLITRPNKANKVRSGSYEDRIGRNVITSHKPLFYRITSTSRILSRPKKNLIDA